MCFYQGIFLHHRRHFFNFRIIFNLFPICQLYLFHLCICFISVFWCKIFIWDMKQIPGSKGLILNKNDTRYSWIHVKKTMPDLVFLTHTHYRGCMTLYFLCEQTSRKIHCSYWPYYPRLKTVCNKCINM